MLFESVKAMIQIVSTAILRNIVKPAE